MKLWLLYLWEFDYEKKRYFSETNVYFYLHNEHDRDVIEQVKILKEQRKLNALIYRLLKDHFESERQLLISDLQKNMRFWGLGVFPTRRKPFCILAVFLEGAECPRTDAIKT